MFAQETKEEKSEEIKREQTIFISFSVFRFAFFKKKKTIVSRLRSNNKYKCLNILFSIFSLLMFIKIRQNQSL